MCDYSLRAVASRRAQAGETLISTTFRGTSTRGFASESDPNTAVCMLPGTKLRFAENIRYDNRWIWPKTLDFSEGVFAVVDPHIPDRHHDSIELADGTTILVTQLCDGQRVEVVELPMSQQLAEAKPAGAEVPEFLVQPRTTAPAPAVDETGGAPARTRARELEPA